MRALNAGAIAVSLATAGCVLGARAGGGATVSHGGVAGEASVFGVAYGFGSNSDSILTRVDGRVGDGHAVVSGGPEWNVPLAHTPHPIGLRLRPELGGYISTSSSSWAPLVGFVAGVFWHPFTTEKSTQSFALALETPLEVRLGVDEDPHVRPIAGVMLFAEYFWTPCSILGGASCTSCGSSETGPCPRTDGAPKQTPLAP